MASNSWQSLRSSLPKNCKQTLTSFIRLAKSVHQLSNVRTHHDGMSLSTFKEMLDTKCREMKTLRMMLSTEAQKGNAVPGIQTLFSHLFVFEDTLSAFVNDSSEGDCIILEKPNFDELMHCSGVLEGYATMLLEQSAFLETKAQGINLECQVWSSSCQSPRHPNTPLHISVPSLQPLSSLESPGDKFQRTSPRTGHIFSHNVDPSVQESCTSNPSVLSVTAEDDKMVTVNLESHSLDCIASLWKEQKHTDVTFLVGSEKKPVRAHRAILAAHSSYFKSLLYGDMLEASKEEILLFDIPQPPLFVSLVEYTYTGQLHILKEDILEILALADRFALTTLKDTLGNSLVPLVSIDNVFTFIAYADVYQVKHLLDKCLCLIDKSSSFILRLDSFCSLSPSVVKLVISRDTFVAPEMDIFAAVVRWKDNNSKDSEVDDVLNCIRLSEIPAKDLFTAVEPTKLFGQSEITTALRIQIKPEFQKRKPRGKKEVGRNLFELARFSSSGNVEYSGKATMGPPRIMDGIVEMDASQVNLESKEEGISSSIFGGSASNLPSHSLFHLSHGQRPATRRSNPVPTLFRTKMLEFSDVHLVNTIKILAFPEKNANAFSSSQADYSPLSQWRFSYKIKISRDKESWETLFDFSEVDCYFSQTLHFPVQAIKYIDFQLVSCKNPVRLKFLSCSLEDTVLPFRFLDKGVIGYLSLGALEYFEIFELPPGHPTSVEVVTLVIVLPSPASMTHLRFRICCPGESVSGDIQTSTSCVWDYSSFKCAGELPGYDLRDELLWNFEERVVSYILVHIANIKKKSVALILATINCILCQGCSIYKPVMTIFFNM